MMRLEYDMVVIGGGAAGLTSAGMSALLGAKTALIERGRLGGECTWTGCIPSKALLGAARAAQQIRTADRFGLASTEPEIVFARVMEHVRSVRQHVYEEADAPPNMERLGVEVVPGSARFLDPHTVEVTDGSGTRRLRSRFFVIATGSRPKKPEFAEPALTNESLFELTERPRRLLVLGAGPVGIEMAQAFRRLGSEVVVVAPGEGILRRDDPAHAAILRDCLAREGVKFRFGRRVTGVEQGKARLDNGEVLACDAVLAATGRRPSVDGLQLEKAGVRVGEKGVGIDTRCRTSQRHIYAAGDVTGRHQFTHMAEHMAKVAVTNALLRWPKSLDEKHVVWCTFTDPELATLGESEEDLRRRGAKYGVFRLPFDRLDRAITEGETAGEIKVFGDPAGRILGASIVGAQAGEMISHYALAMRNHIRMQNISDTVHPYPTFTLGNRRVADQFGARQLDSPLLGLLGKVLRYRGTRKGSAAL